MSRRPSWKLMWLLQKSRSALADGEVVLQRILWSDSYTQTSYIITLMRAGSWLHTVDFDCELCHTGVYIKQTPDSILKSFQVDIL